MKTSEVEKKIYTQEFLNMRNLSISRGSQARLNRWTPRIIKLSKALTKQLKKLPKEERNDFVIVSVSDMLTAVIKMNTELEE